MTRFVVLGALVLFVLLGCFASGYDEIRQQELERQISPDGLYQLVMYLREGGAGTSTRYFFEVVPSGSGVNPDRSFAMVGHIRASERNARLEGPSAGMRGDWTSAGTVSISLPPCTAYRRLDSASVAGRAQPILIKYVSIEDRG